MVLHPSNYINYVLKPFGFFGFSHAMSCVSLFVEAE
jgi:hypothetical protein